jgi:protein gp37
MSDNSAIEWTDATWNPVTGCTKVSPGCDHCYAETFAERFRGVPGHHFERGFDVVLRPERLAEPMRWRRPRMVFVNSMSDLFHKDVPDEFIDKVFMTMCEASQHTFQVLTKRPERMRRFVTYWYKQHGYFYGSNLRNVWFGTSVESADYAWRADMLRETPAAVRFLSLEPLLGHIPAVILRDMDWVIVGGESGPGARPMDAQWVRDIRDDCEAMSIPFFFKQWGGVRKKEAGRELDGRTYDEFPKASAAA